MKFLMNGKKFDSSRDREKPIKFPLGVGQVIPGWDEGIQLLKTGEKAKFNSKNTIIEAYKSKNILNGKVLYSDNNRLDTNNILKFY